MKFSLKRHSSPGFTLVEVMISMLITLIVMGGVYQTLTDESVEHDRSEKILDMQNNARVALGRLTRDVRRTGFLGCGGEQLVNTLSTAGTDATRIGKLTVADPGVMARDMDYNTILKQLIDYHDDPALAFVAPAPVVDVDYLGEALGFSNDAPAAHPHYQAGTDAITLVYLTDERAVEEPPDTNTASSDIQLTSKGFAWGDILYATDCDDFSMFQKTSSTNTFTVKHDLPGSNNSLNNSVDLGKVYGRLALARVFKLTTETYFIHTGDYNLCHNTTSQQIASNIEDLQFEFLFDENNNGNLTDDAWVTNLGTHTSKEVWAIRIWVLAMSDTDFAYTDTNTYDYPNSPYYTPNPNAVYRDAAGNLKPANPFASANGLGGSPSAMAPIASPTKGEHRHRFLASTVVNLRNAGLN